jgi:hypothetical protein
MKGVEISPIGREGRKRTRFPRRLHDLKGACKLAEFLETVTPEESDVQEIRMTRRRDPGMTLWIDGVTNSLATSHMTKNTSRRATSLQAAFQRRRETAAKTFIGSIPSLWKETGNFLLDKLKVAAGKTRSTTLDYIVNEAVYQGRFHTTAGIRQSLLYRLKSHRVTPVRRWTRREPVFYCLRQSSTVKTDWLERNRREPIDKRPRIKGRAHVPKGTGTKATTTSRGRPRGTR